MERAKRAVSSAAATASYVAARALEISQDEELNPAVRLMGAHALVDELARALARMLVESQPEGAHPPSEPSR